MFQKVGILHHPNKPDSVTLAQEVDVYLRAAGIDEIWHESAWQTENLLDHIADIDMLITLGGDGTMLRTARMGAPHKKPMLGVKMGRLGFLAEVMPDDWQRPLDQILSGDYWIEERQMLRARVERITGEEVEGTVEREIICEYDALNDVVLGRGDLARVVRIDAQLDEGYLTRYTCDGMIVSTATGSTGYALAVGGPILPPRLRNILVIPIAPHLCMDRAVILSEGAEVRLQAFSDSQPMLTVDGQFVIELSENDEVVVVGSPHLARFIRTRDQSYFYQTLMDKLKWTV